jgi:large subunit ribosomal protein L10
MPTAKKSGTIDELTESLGKAQLTIVTDYRGLSVSDLQGFRAALRPKGAEFRVAKNTLTNIAAGRAGIEGFDGMLEGPSGLVIIQEDIVGASKVVSDFVRTSRVLQVKGGVLNNKQLSASDIEALATMPSREELQAKLLGLMVSPMSRTLGVLGGPARSMVYLLNAKAEQGGSAAAD